MTSGARLGRATVTGWLMAALLLGLTAAHSDADRKNSTPRASQRRAKRAAMKSRPARGQKARTAASGVRPRWHPGLELARSMAVKHKPVVKR
jgi:hypothetical protein